MNCSRNLLTLGAMFLLAVSPTLRAEDATAKGVNYLISKQAEDGSWNSEDKLKLVDSSESFQALIRTTGGENSLNKSLQFFSALTGDNNETLAFKLIALSSSTATIDALVTQLGNMQKSDGGWGLADVQKGSIPYTITVMNALLKSGKSTNTILSKGAEFLVKQQDANGAWIFTSEHSLSDTAHTAMALIILKKVQNDNIFSGSGLEQAILKAQQYLESKNNSGSYGTIVDSAWAYLALCRIKQPSEMSATLTLIQNSQLDNGSWNDTIYDTAVCLQALTAIQVPQTDLPDLEILEKNISFSPTAPLTGNEVTISATIFNNGELDAENVKIEFFNRDPRLDGVEIAPAQTVNLIPAGGSIQVSAKFVSTGMVGPVQIVIFVDRENTIREVSKANNAAAKIISVGGMPDLSIASGDITLSNPNPAPFETVDLTVVIHNIGNEAVTNIPVKIFDNDKLFYEFIMSGVNAESSNKAIITTGFSAETHNIRVEVDPDHTITNEINLANNTASTSFTIDKDAEKPLDIAVESIVFDPAAPLSTSPTKITVTIANLGGIDATTAFNTTLSVDGTVIGTISVPQLLGGQKAVLNFTNITLGFSSVYAMSRFFKKKYGISPMQYRKKFKS